MADKVADLSLPEAQRVAGETENDAKDIYSMSQMSNWSYKMTSPPTCIHTNTLICAENIHQEGEAKAMSEKYCVLCNTGSLQP